LATPDTGTPLSTPSPNPLSLPGGNRGKPPNEPPVGYRFPTLDPNRWYSVQEAALRYGTGDDFFRRLAEQWCGEGREGVIFRRRKNPGRTRYYTFTRIKGSLLLAWEREWRGQ
jgi:hypothetical protein